MDNVKETNYHKIWQRIIKPFFLTELFLIITTLCLRFTTRELDGLFNYFKMIIKFGGGGSGSYYPWIYSQFAIILPLIVPIFRKIKGFKLAVTFILISSTLEIICNVANLPNFIYRILFFRYTMLIYLGYLLATKGYVLNLKTGLLSILSVSSVLLIVYSNLTFSPFLYFDPKWESCHWICYFYIAFLLLFILKFLYQTMIRYEKVCGYVKKIGIYSYEIFLFQMFYFDFHKYVVKSFSWFTDNSMIVNMSAIIFSVIICIVPVVAYKDYQAYKQLRN